MNRKLQSKYQTLKASVLLLCLGLLIVGTCPIQKLLLSAASIPIEAPSSKPTKSTTLTNSHLTCSLYEEMVKAPLVELTKKSNNIALYFVLLSTVPFLLSSFGRKRSSLPIKGRISMVSPIPLFLKNQVFII